MELNRYQSKNLLKETISSEIEVLLLREEKYCRDTLSIPSPPCTDTSPNRMSPVSVTFEPFSKPFDIEKARAGVCEWMYGVSDFVYCLQKTPTLFLTISISLHHCFNNRSLTISN